MIKSMLIAGIGGFIGTCGRYLVGKVSSHWLDHTWAQPFPLGTFLVNIIGCFIIGMLFGMAEKYHFITPNMSILLITGFCGGFTTFSSMSDDMYLLVQGRHMLLFVLYLVLTLVLGFLLVWAGRAIFK